MNDTLSATVPYRWLLALSMAVLLVHLLLLQATPLSLGLSPTPPAPIFTTRLLNVTPAENPPSHPPRAPARPRPAPVQAPVPVIDEGAVPASPNPNATPPANTQATLTPEAPPADASTPSAAPRQQRENTAWASAYAVPGSVRVKYQVTSSKLPFSASAELLWQQQGESYEARMALSMFGQSRVQTSRGLIGPEGLSPLRFSDKYRSEVAAHFDRENGKVTFSANTPDAPLLAGAQDRLSVLIQLATMIAGKPSQYTPATTLTLQVIGPREADTWLFTVGNEETLSLPGGTQRTLKLVRNPRQEYDQQVELWLAPALGYLPARIKITETHGESIDQQWVSSQAVN